MKYLIVFILLFFVNCSSTKDISWSEDDEKIIIVDLDNRKIGEDPITEFTWPESQFDDDRVKELLKEH